MAYELYEGFANGALLLQELSEASKAASDGGTKITISEMVAILAKVGVEVARDVTDDEEPE